MSLDNYENTPDYYYLSQQEPAKSCLLTLQHIIKKHDDQITEAIKWAIPCFMYKNKMFCFLNVDKKSKEPYILFAEGDKLNHPLLEKGSRSRMKILKINPTFDLPLETIDLIIKQAIDLYRNGIIRIK